MDADAGEDALWQATNSARQSYFEATVGPLPKDIQKMLNMTGVWPGGGLYVIPASRIGQHLALYTTFGLTNPDMPATTRMLDFRLTSDGHRPAKAEGKLEKKIPAPKRAGAAGYGYEIFVIAREGQSWPLGFLQWAVQAEIASDVCLLDRVEKYDGLTVESIDVGSGAPINVLISKALAPLPVGAPLPNGRMELLVATTITESEMRWSDQNGRNALLHKLLDAGIGQISSRDRPSVAGQ